MTAKDATTAGTYAQARRRIDATGLLCPLPVLKLQKALRDLAPGEQVHLHATDPATRIDVPHFCATSGHILRQAHAEAGVWSYVVERGDTGCDDTGHGDTSSRDTGLS